MKPTNRHVVLIGMMGVGKTTVGRLLAERLGWRFWDNDVALTQAKGRTAAQVERKDGVAALHRLELQLLRSALATKDPTVFAAGGSIVLDPEVVENEVTVWLRASAAREAQNVAHSGQHHRPLPEDPAALLNRLTTQRAPLYARIAKITVNVGSDPALTCERVWDALVKQGNLYGLSQGS